jgi:hypothetical protein
MARSNQKLRPIRLDRHRSHVCGMGFAHTPPLLAAKFARPEIPRARASTDRLSLLARAVSFPLRSGPQNSARHMVQTEK